MAGAYGIERAFEFSNPIRSCGRTRNLANCANKSPVLSRHRPRDPCQRAYATARIPPTMLVTINAIKSWPGPIQAPTPAASFRSPIPLPPKKQGTPNSTQASARPAKLLPAPGNPPASERTSNPEMRNGSTNQLGIRLVWTSIIDATTRTATLGHQAIESISCYGNSSDTSHSECLFY